MARRLEYRRYTDEFKSTAVRLSKVSGVQSKDVAEALDIHPLMLSRWRKDFRDGKISKKGKQINLEDNRVRELKRLQQIEKEHKLLQEEHLLLKKTIQFKLERKKKHLSS
jgi:transposase